jgi:hypothetical protein
MGSCQNSLGFHRPSFIRHFIRARGHKGITMAVLDQAALIERLQLLGAESDETALQAARDAADMVRAAGTTWAELLGAGTAPAAAAESAVPQGKAPMSEDARLVERLLARKDISDTLRGDLNDFKQQIAAGTLDKTDADYLRALAKRLNA